MDEWIRQTLSASEHGLAVLPAAFMLGLLGSVSSCCTLPVLDAVAGKVVPVLRVAVGVLLVGLGFYLLAPA